MSRNYDNNNNNRGPRNFGNNDGNRGGNSRGNDNRGEFVRVNNNARSDVTVDALVAFARSILNERQLGDLSERLQSRRPQSRQEQPARTSYDDTRRGRGGRGGFGGRGANGDEGRIPAFEGRGRGGRAPRGGLNDQRERERERDPRPVSAPSTQQPREPRRRNNRRPNADV